MTSNPPSRAPPLPPSARSYPHLQDLVALTNGLQATDRGSIKSWLETADRHWHQAKAHRVFGRLDSAYVDYLLAFTIVIDIIPRCAEWPTFTRGKQSQNYEQLKKVLNSYWAEYTEVKEAIKRNNEISGVQSSAELAAKGAQNGHFHRSTASEGGALRGSSAPAPSHKSTVSESGQYVAMPSPKKPEIPPKKPFLSMPDPRQFQGQDSINSPVDQRNGVSGKATPEQQDLEARFRRLGSPRGSNGNATPPSTNGVPTPTSSSDSTTVRSGPRGPRVMPRPPALDISALPQIPAPTYSPATSFASPGGFTQRRPSLPVGRSSLERQEPSPRKVIMPEGNWVNAESLKSYMSQGSGISVLLLDVRRREEFDEGHIYQRSIVCIEPLVLREGMSADDLEASFILAPPKEHEIFSRRHNYDLVVYYDQSTQELDIPGVVTSDEYLLALRSLYLALNQYSYSKQLKRPPMLLLGGLDAWIDLVGKQSLETSNTRDLVNMAQNGIALRGPSPLPARVPTPQQLMKRQQARRTNGSSLPPPLHRNRLHTDEEPDAGTPMTGDEERRWMDLLHKESEPVVINIPTSDDVKKRRRGTSIVSRDNTDLSYHRTVQDFFQKYPAAPSFPESMTTPTSPQFDGEGTTPRRNMIDHPFGGFTDVKNPDYTTSPARPPPVVPRKSYSGVSERLVPAATSAPATVPERPPKLPLAPSGLGSVNLPTTGLKNLGNTCYMNSILQCMNGTRPISRYFLDGSYKGHINKNNPLGSRGVLAEAYANIVRHLSSGDFNFISPVTFKDVSGRLNETFRSNHQQDAQEFLEFLLDGLHEDLNMNAGRTKLATLSDTEERHREKMAMQVASGYEWGRYLHLNHSIIVNWLQGQLASRLRCLTCSVTSTTYSPFMYLTLPIPEGTKGRNVSLHDCLQEFCREEVLEQDDQWNCPACKKPRKATKKLTITRLPHVLIVHLKRFSSKGRWRNKLDTFINFPLADLDLTSYVPPPLAPQQMPKDLPQDLQATPPFFYDLYSISNHYGNLEGGHYTAFVRNLHRWTVFDDTRATALQDSAVVTSNAYVLFWVRKGVM